MTTPKPGEEMTYRTGYGSDRVERTGVVLDRGPSPMSEDYGEGRKPLDVRFWVHREDGTFDLVQYFTRGQHKGRTVWHGWFTAGGRPLGRHNLPLSA
jgi:hypothetical protein